MAINVTGPTPVIGCDAAAKIAQKDGKTLKKEAFASTVDYDRILRPEDMIGPMRAAAN